MAWGLVKQNVAQHATIPTVRPHPVLTIIPGPVKAILAARYDHRLEAFFLLTGVTGALQRELLGLTWDQLDLAAGRWRIDQTLQRQKQDDGNRGWVIKDPKTAHSQRLLPLPPPVAPRHGRTYASR